MITPVNGGNQPEISYGIIVVTFVLFKDPSTHLDLEVENVPSSVLPLFKE
jgi:hypothetical protein